MKLMQILVAGAAILASSACNAEKGGNSAAVSSAPVKPIAPPKGGDWTKMVNETPEGGFVMGNPNAPVKLIEYGSLTCPHCAEFDEVGAKPLIDKYVKAGQVSWEFRNFVRDPYDITASLVARCGGTTSFFGLTRGLYAEQKDWIAKVQAASPEQQQALAGMQPQQQFSAMAQLAGFPQWAAMRGVPTAKSAACLADQGAVTKLVQMQSDAISQFDIPGTPSFIINGTLVEGATWEMLEPKLRAAIGS
ncbi:MAG TPA: thioredoxin domain-containing protein [Sphingomicrobium sp.]|nr:thioredoxin domain-containing protein [Sphingomicrobium sp.]